MIRVRKQNAKILFYYFAGFHDNQQHACRRIAPILVPFSKKYKSIAAKILADFPIF